MNLRLRTFKTSRWAILVTMLMTAAWAVAQVETIDATARGTSTQMGKQVGIKLIINQFSTPDDKEALKNAFLQGGHNGLVQALFKMKAVGRIQIPGTVGFPIAYAESIPTPTGRKIRFVTNRRVTFAEQAKNTRSKAYDLTAGEIDINDQDKNKSMGILYPAAQLIINNDGELQLELLQNPWQLVNIIDWKPKEKQ